MPITVHIPTPLRPECGGMGELSVMATTVREVLDRLEIEYPALYRGVCNDAGAIRQHINLFVNNDFLHQRNGLETQLGPEDVVYIMPAVSGG